MSQCSSENRSRSRTPRRTITNSNLFGFQGMTLDWDLNSRGSPAPSIASFIISNAESVPQSYHTHSPSTALTRLPNLTRILNYQAYRNVHLGHELFHEYTIPAISRQCPSRFPFKPLCASFSPLSLPLINLKRRDDYILISHSQHETDHCNG